jgi:hypothetical protein
MDYHKDSNKIIHQDGIIINVCVPKDKDSENIKKKHHKTGNLKNPQSQLFN